jgi:hypothetical protein
MITSMFLNHRYYIFGLILSILLSHSFSAPAASAKTFKKLVETGQKVSDAPLNGESNEQPIESISAATIGRDGQTAVFLKKKAIATPPGPPQPGFEDPSIYLGIYSISKGGKIALVNRGTIGTRSGFINSFTSPSISEGLIAYGTYITGPAFRGGFQPPISDLRVGTPGDVKFYPSIYVFRRGGEVPDVSFADGLVYVLERSSDTTSTAQSRTLRRLNTKTPNPQFTTLSSDPNNRAIRTSSRRLVLSSVSDSQVYRLFERPHEGEFSELKPIGNNPGSCGFAVSYDNIVSCSVDNGKSVLSARFGATGNFIKIPLANEAATQSIESPSMSQKQILFLANEEGPTGKTRKIYISNNGGPSTAVIGTGEMLDGKTISFLSLSDNGRAIADNYVVFKVQFTDGVQALYRVDL